jgi:hypothetical protein
MSLGREARRVEACTGRLLGCRGKHIIVDVGIFEGRDSILVDPPNQEDCSEEKRKSEDVSW